MPGHGDGGDRKHGGRGAVVLRDGDGRVAAAGHVFRDCGKEYHAKRVVGAKVDRVVHGAEVAVEHPHVADHIGGGADGAPRVRCRGRVAASHVRRFVHDAARGAGAEPRVHRIVSSHVEHNGCAVCCPRADGHAGAAAGGAHELVAVAFADIAHAVEAPIGDGGHAARRAAPVVRGLVYALAEIGANDDAIFVGGFVGHGVTIPKFLRCMGPARRV